jgi:hypothetical protein
MADEAMQPDPAEGEKDILQTETEIPVHLDSLEADGVRPRVGDTVTLRVEGTVHRIENDCAYVTPDAINDTDLAEILAEHAPADEDSLMAKLTSAADASGTPMGGY